MQDSLATENTEGNFCSSRRENFSIPTDEVSSQLQETATLPSTKESTKDDLTPKHTVSQHLEKNKGEVPSPIATGPFRETRGTTMPSGRFKKVCEGVFRILTPIAILGICSLPIALYFTVPVRASHIHFISNNMNIKHVCMLYELQLIPHQFPHILCNHVLYNI